MKNKYQVSKDTLATIGWAMYYKGYTKEQLDSMTGVEVLMLKDDYSRWLEEEINSEK